jgi:hypothetical protein
MYINSQRTLFVTHPSLNLSHIHSTPFGIIFNRKGTDETNVHSEKKMSLANIVMPFILIILMTMVKASSVEIRDYGAEAPLRGGGSVARDVIVSIFRVPSRRYSTSDRWQEVVK